MADNTCSECGATYPEPHDKDCPLGQSSVVDRRGSRELPEVDEAAIVAQADATAFSDEEAQRILADQAEWLEETPYSGGGVQGEPDAVAKKPCITVFAVILHMDGTCLAHHDVKVLDEYEPMMPASPRQIYAAAMQMKLDIEAVEVAQTTMTVLEQRTAAVAAMARAQQTAGVQDAVRANTRPRRR